jgi:hypothetical protein
VALGMPTVCGVVCGRLEKNEAWSIDFRVGPKTD